MGYEGLLAYVNKVIEPVDAQFLIEKLKLVDPTTQYVMYAVSEKPDSKVRVVKVEPLFVEVGSGKEKQRFPM